MVVRQSAVFHSVESVRSDPVGGSGFVVSWLDCFEPHVCWCRLSGVAPLRSEVLLRFVEIQYASGVNQDRRGCFVVGIR